MCSSMRESLNLFINFEEIIVGVKLIFEEKVAGHLCAVQ